MAEGRERKGSGSSDQSGNPDKLGDSKSAKGGDIADLQKKMKILKDALVKERQEKEGALKAKKDIDKELERARGQLQEKDSFLLRLKEESSDLQAKLQIEKKKNETPNAQGQKQDGLSDIVGSSIAGLSGIFGGRKENAQPKAPAVSPEEIQKLATDHNNVKKQIEATQEKLLKIDSTAQQARKEILQQTEGLQKKLQELQRDLEGRVQAYKELEQKYEEVSSIAKRLKWDKEGLEDEQKKLRSENDTLHNIRDELEKEHNEKTKIADELKEVCQKMKSELQKQSEKSEKITNQLEEADLNQQIFNVKKVVKGKSVPAQILMRKTITGEYLVEIETETERWSVLAQSVQSFGLVKETENQFFFDYKGSRGELVKEVYESEDRKKIARNLKGFVRLAEENKVKKDESKGKPSKGLINQMVSFFNN